MTKVKYWSESSRIPLLKAAFLSGTPALEAWPRWKSQINIDDHPDLGSFRLLPQLYRNLKEQGVDDPLMMKLKGVARKAWYSNQRFFDSITQPLQALHQTKIKAMLLYGPAMTLQYSSDYRLESTSTLAILVPPYQAVSAVECLQQKGWVSESNLQASAVESHLTSAYMHIFDDALQRRIQLHWHLLPECCRMDSDENFWAGAVETKVLDVPVYILNPADHLLHICVQDTIATAISPFLKAVDAMFIISTAQTKLDWERLVEQAIKRKLILPVINILFYLQKNLGNVFPPKILDQLTTAPISKQERFEFKSKYSNRVIWRRTSRLWFNYLRQTNRVSLPQKVIGFPGYLQHYWCLENIRQVPWQAVSVAYSRVRHLG